MDRPRLRPLEAFPIEERGQKLLALRDPSGLAEGLARLPPLAVAVVQLFDGESTRDEIVAEFTRRYQRPLERKTLDQLIQQLDEALLLDSDHFRQHAAKVFADFARSEVRPAALAGRSYPSDPTELAGYLDGFFAAPHGPGAPAATPTGPLPRAIVAPHVDFARGGAAYAWAYKPLAEAAELPELIVVFGTDHLGSERTFALTKKHYETPLGRMETDVALVSELTAAVRERLGAPSADGLFYDEHHHRGEHSIEFQMVWLRKVLGARADGVKVLPVLTGSLRHLIEDGRDPSTDSEVSVVLGELRRLTAGRRTLFIAGADLAHVGPRYGDPEPLDRDDLGSLERRDQQTLAHVTKGDAKGWFDEIAREKDRRNVCGLSPIYALLATTDLTASPGKLLAYGQCPADERNTSVVSIASIVF
jgi:AmmeMemoRadiSam system protein B